METSARFFLSLCACVLVVISAATEECEIHNEHLDWAVIMGRSTQMAGNLPRRIW